MRNMNEFVEQLKSDKKWYTAQLNHNELIDELKFYSQQLYDNTVSHTPYEQDCIRYKQAEIYWELFKDYDVAISKWDAVKSKELVGWAEKNIGDGYAEKGDLIRAEAKYLSVNTSDKILQLETLLALYKLYISSNDSSKLLNIVNQLVKIDLNYKDIYDLAKLYYEDTSNYSLAFQLSVEKLKHTYDNALIERLIGYLERSGEHITPSATHINMLINSVIQNNSGLLWDIVERLHDYYKQSHSFLDWLHVVYVLVKQNYVLFNDLLLSEHPELLHGYIQDLHLGNYVESEIKDIITIHYKMYYTLTKNESLKNEIAALLLAWEESFPSRQQDLLLMDVEQSLSGKLHRLEHVIEVFQNIQSWVKKETKSWNNLNQFWLEFYLNRTNKKVMLIGSFSNGKSSFINSILETNLMSVDHLPTTSAVTMIQYGSDEALFEISSTDIKEINISDFRNQTIIDHASSSNFRTNILRLTTDIKALQDYQITLIDTPGFNDENHNSNPTLNYLNVADEIYFILNSETPYKKTERDLLLKIKELHRELPVRFILNKADYLDEEELEEVVEDLEKKLSKNYEGTVYLHPYSSVEVESESRNNIAKSFRSFTLEMEQRRIKHVIPYLKDTVVKAKLGLENMEKDLHLAVRQQQTMIAKLNEHKTFLQDSNRQLIKEIIQSYLSDMVVQANNEIYRICYQGLQTFNNVIHAQTNLKQVHVQLHFQANQWMLATLHPYGIQIISQTYTGWLPRFMDILERYEEKILHTSKVNFSSDMREINCGTRRQVLMDNLQAHFNKLLANMKYNSIESFKRVDPIESILFGVGKILGGRIHAADMQINRYRQYLEDKIYNDFSNEYTQQLNRELSRFHESIIFEINEYFKIHEHITAKQVSNEQDKLIKFTKVLQEFMSKKVSNENRAKMFTTLIRKIEIEYHS